jgi:hypothetical protein
MYRPIIQLYVVWDTEVDKYNNNNNNNNKPLIFKTFHYSIFISERTVSYVTLNDR